MGSNDRCGETAKEVSCRAVFLAIGLAPCMGTLGDAQESTPASPDDAELLVMVCRLCGRDLPVSVESAQV